MMLPPGISADLLATRGFALEMRRQRAFMPPSSAGNLAFRLHRGWRRASAWLSGPLETPAAHRPIRRRPLLVTGRRRLARLLGRAHAAEGAPDEDVVHDLQPTGQEERHTERSDTERP